MISYFNFIFISIILIKFTIIQTHKINNTKEICVKNPFQTISSTNNFTVYYLNDRENQSIFIWFTNEKLVNDTFDSYRFILRSIDDVIPSNIIIKILTNFTKLIDFHNSLRIFYLDSGQYEICIEFQLNFSKFIYQPRDGCIDIEIGKLFHQSFKQNSIPLLIALTSGIVLFFILGLIVQWTKAKHQNNNNKLRSSSSSILSTIILKQQRDHLIKNLFYRYIDQPQSSHIRQWARNRAFRHRILTEKQEFEKLKSLQKWNKLFLTSINQSLQPNLTTNNISPISEKEHIEKPSRNISFDLYPSDEEYEMTKY